jgi:hydrogenase-4 component B
MEKYGSLIKSMPVTAFTFLLASISISALPPTNGFLSEWMIFQSMLSSSSISQISLKISIPFAVFALALTGGLAIACFVKAYGITFLGLARSENAKHAKESNFLMKTGMVLMSLVVVSLMLVTPVYIKLFDKATAMLHKISIYDMIYSDGSFSMHSIAHNGGVVTPVVLLLALMVITFILMIFYKSLKLPVRSENSWACGYQTNHRTQYSATGFAGPIRRFFSWLYKPEEHYEKVTFHGHESKFKTALYEVHVKPLFEKSLYANIKKSVNFISYFVYKVAHFEQSRYAAIIFNLMLSVLFGYRIVSGNFSWANLILEAILLFISVKILLIGDKR